MTLTPAQFKKLPHGRKWAGIPKNNFCVHLSSIHFTKGAVRLLSLPRNIVFHEVDDMLIIEPREDGFEITLSGQFHYNINSRGLCEYFLKKYGGPRVHFEILKVGDHFEAKRFAS